MQKTPIEWADYSSNPIRALNPVTGHRGHFCVKVSPGCAHCYASEQNARGLYPMSSTGLAYLPVNESKVELYLNEKELLEWKRPSLRGKRVFVCDMTDWAGEWVKDEWHERMFEAMDDAPQVTFMLLTKRAWEAQRIITSFQGESWPLPNVWLGVTVENQRWADERIPILLDTPAAVRFLSCEPLLGPLDLRPWIGAGEWRPGGAHSLNWVICGGESAGPAKRALIEPCPTHARNAQEFAGGKPFWYACPDCIPISATHRVKPEALAWVRSLRDQCVAAGVPFHFKQWGGPKPKSGGRLLDGWTWNEYPA